MKKYTEAYVRALPTPTGRVDPAPFPGKYPTRWYIKLEGYDGGVWQYQGKPNATVFRAFLKRLVTRKPAQALFVEHDKQHTLRSVTSRNATYFGHNRMCASLLRRYYYWLVNTGEFLPMLEKFYLKKILFNGRRLAVYAPRPKLSIANEIEPFKTWLRANYGDKAR